MKTPTPLTGVLFGRLNDNRGDPDSRVLIPGDPFHSQLLQRLAVRGPGQMPPLSTSIPDPEGVSLIQRWIEELGDPRPAIPEFLELTRQDGRLLLHLRQPANRSLQLEFSPSIEPPLWTWQDLPGNEPFFPALPREWNVELPDVGGGYFRLRPYGP